MAYRKKTAAPKDDEQSPEQKKSTQANKELLVRIRQRYKVMIEADRDNRTAALDDIRFLRIPGEQWDKTVKNERGDRPAYEFNKLAVKADRIINDMRANRPQGKVRGTEDGDKDTADVLEGLCRNIFAASDGDTICDYAGEYQVGGGMGAWRVDTKYAEDSFDQDICLAPIKNPFCLYADPAATDPLKRDAEDWILTERISNSSYAAKYKNAQRVNFEDTEFDDDDEWEDDNTTRICEYWYKEYYDKELWLLNDGKVVDSTKPENASLANQVVKKRVVKCPRIMMCIASGNAILEGPKECAGTHHRFVMVFGKWLVIDGKVIWFGLTRHAKDAQRRYNVSQTAVTETIATAPQSKYWATTKQMEGHLEKWNVAHAQNLPFLGYTHDPNAPGPPQRMPGPDVPVALIQESVMADQDLKDVTGVYDPSLGAKSNETSGRAITRRAEQSELVNFNFPDNMAKGIRRTWEIMLDLIPHIYDTERTIRILGTDGAEKFVKINSFTTDPTTGEQKAVNDLRRGKYDVTITTGPSFATQRQEASELYVGLLQGIPQLGVVAPDLIMKTFDTPYSEEFAERLRMFLPPQIQQSLSEGKPIPPEVQAVVAQAKQAMQLVQQQAQLVQAAAQEAETGKAEADKAKAEVEKAIAQFKTEQAQFDAKVAQTMAKFAEKQAQLTVQAVQAEATQGKSDLEGEKQQLVAAASEAVQNMQGLLQQFMAASADTLQQIAVQRTAQAAPRRRQMRAKRVNGELVATIDDLDDAGNVTGSREARVRRENGELVGQI